MPPHHRAGSAAPRHARPLPLSRPAFGTGTVLAVSTCFLGGPITRHLVVAEKTFSVISIKVAAAAQSSQTGPAGSLLALRPAEGPGAQTCHHPGDACAPGFHLRAQPAAERGLQLLCGKTRTSSPPATTPSKETVFSSRHYEQSFPTHIWHQSPSPLILKPPIRWHTCPSLVCVTPLGCSWGGWQGSVSQGQVPRAV